MNIFTVNYGLDFEFDADLGMFSSFDKAVEAILEFLHRESGYCVPDRVDNMAGITGAKDVFVFPYDSMSISEHEVDGDRAPVNFWIVDVERFDVYGHSPEFCKKGKTFTEEIVRDAIYTQKDYFNRPEE